MCDQHPYRTSLTEAASEERSIKTQRKRYLVGLYFTLFTVATAFFALGIVTGDRLHHSGTPSTCRDTTEFLGNGADKHSCEPDQVSSITGEYILYCKCIHH